MAQRCNPLSDSLASSTTFPVVAVLAPRRALHCGMRKTQATITHIFRGLAFEPLLLLLSGAMRSFRSVNTALDQRWIPLDASRHHQSLAFSHLQSETQDQRHQLTNWELFGVQISQCNAHWFRIVFSNHCLFASLYHLAPRQVIRSCFRGDLSSQEKLGIPAFLKINFPANNFL